MKSKTEIALPTIFVSILIIVAMIAKPLIIIGLNWLVTMATGVTPLGVTFSFASIFALILVSIVYSIILFIMNILLSLLLAVSKNISIILYIITGLICIPFAIYLLYAALRTSLNIVGIEYINNYVVILLALFYYIMRVKKKKADDE